MRVSADERYGTLLARNVLFDYSMTGRSVFESDLMRSTKSRPRTKPPEERRDELMNAARRLFLKQGVGPTTIEQITSGAGVAKGTFYLYFSSKEDVLAALADRYGDDLLVSIKAAIAQRANDDWRGKLAAWATATISAYLD